MTGTRTRRHALGIAALVLLLVGCGTPPPPDGRRAILVVLDAARADRLSTYGYARDTSPHIDALARDGVVFQRCFAQGAFTREALPSLFFSRYFATPLFPSGFDVPLVTSAELFAARDPEAMSLPRILAGAGFRTAALSAHTWLGEDTPLAHEFDEFRDLSTRLAYERRRFYPRGEQVVEQAVAWLAQHRREDVFLYLHLMDTHTPFFFEAEARRWYAGEPPPRTRIDELGRPTDRSAALVGRERAYLDALYDGAIAHADGALGPLFDWLARNGPRDRTVVVLTADHGEALLEHPGRLGHAAWYDEVARIPCVVAAPGRLAPARVEAFAEQVDLAPTMLGLLGVPVPAGVHLDGRDLFAGAPPREHTVSVHGIRGDRWKALFDQASDVLADPPAEHGVLFDLAADPGETVDVRRDHVAEAAALAAAFRARLAEPWRRRQAAAHAAPAPTSPFALSTAELAITPAVTAVPWRPWRELTQAVPVDGWLAVDHALRFALLARGHAPALEVQATVPDGDYDVFLGLRGGALVTLGDGAETREVRSAEPADGDAAPRALWQAERVPLGRVRVQDTRLQVHLAPRSPWVSLRWLYFVPAGAAAPADDAAARERTERLRGLGYVE